jgi:glycogen synthase
MADVCLMTSTKEAWGRVTVEYMILGRPVIGTNTGATKEMVKDGETGYLYEPGDYQSLTKHIKAILGNPEQSKKMGELAMDVVKSINNENYGEEIYNEFKKLVKEENKLSYSAFLSPWFISNYFDGSIAKQFVRGMKHWIFHREIIFKIRHAYKTFRTKLAIKGRIYKVLGKKNPYN